MKNIGLNASDITIPEIVSKQDYQHNKIRYDARYRAKELYGKMFLFAKGTGSSIPLSSYLFAFRDSMKLKEGVVVIADFSHGKDIVLFGTLDNPLDTKSLLKVDYEHDKYYDNNILTFQNWIKFFSSPDAPIHVITNDVNRFKELQKEQEIENYTCLFLDKNDYEKIHKILKPAYVKRDNYVIFLFPIVSFLFAFFITSSVTSGVINSDIESSKKKRQTVSVELSQLTRELGDLEDEEYYKNHEYYTKLSEQKIFKRGMKND